MKNSLIAILAAICTSLLSVSAFAQAAPAGAAVSFRQT
jgi:hypothetical protein